MTAPVDGLPFPDFASSLTTTDRASLAGLSFPEVRAWVVSKADEYQAFVYALLALHNSIAPIHRLPFEILSKIFERCWQDRKSLRIAHVCRRWRSILLQTTSFWFKALARDRLEQDSPTIRNLLGFALAHSAPRDVKLSLAGFTIHCKPVLAPHLERIVSLNVTILKPHHLDNLWTCLNYPGMPELRTLVVNLDEILDGYEDTWYRLRSLQPSALPRLNRLSIPGDLLTLAILPSVRHLHLAHAMRDGNYIYNQLGSLEDFCCTMARFTALETLGLVHASFESSSTFGTLRLPALRSLRVKQSTESADCSSLLYHIELPETTHISYSDWFPGGHGIRAIAHAQSGPICSILQRTTRLRIEFTLWKSWLACYVGDIEMLHVDYCPESEDSRLPHVDSLVRVFRGRAPVTDLVMTINSQTLVDLVDFRAFPHLRRLELDSFFAGDVIAKLAALDDDGMPVCPHLKEIVLNLQFMCTDPMRAALLGLDKPNIVRFIRYSEPLVRLVRALRRRAQNGSHIQRLEFGFEEILRVLRNSPRRLDLSSFGEEDRADALGALGSMVQGPVVFRGIRFSASSDYDFRVGSESKSSEEDWEPDVYHANEKEEPEEEGEGRSERLN